jgi:hypothetical protein
MEKKAALWAAFFILAWHVIRHALRERVDWLVRAAGSAPGARPSEHRPFSRRRAPHYIFRI